jgi:hypothetical protein
MKIELKGDKELIGLFADLGKNTFTDGVIRDIARKGASIVQKAAKDNMPYQLGDLGQEGKKSVVVKASRQNKTAVSVTLGGRGYQSYKGRSVYLAPIIRHFTAGRQADRRTKKGYFRGRVINRYGDFIEKGFYQSQGRAVEVMKKESLGIIKKRWNKLR